MNENDYSVQEFLMVWGGGLNLGANFHHMIVQMLNGLLEADQSLELQDQRMVRKYRLK